MAMAYNRGNNLRNEIEHRLGAPLRDARQSYARYGWEIRAMNGKSLIIDYSYSEELGLSTRYDHHVFTPQYQSYGYHIGYTNDAQAQQVYYDESVSSAGSSHVDPYQNRKKEVLDNLLKEKYRLKEEKQRKNSNLRKLFWSKYTREGKNPLDDKPLDKQNEI